MKKYCMGTQCPVKKTCLRFTSMSSEENAADTMRKCTNQKAYRQDAKAIIQGR